MAADGAVPTALAPSRLAAPPRSGIARAALPAAAAVRPAPVQPRIAALPASPAAPPLVPLDGAASNFVTTFLDDAFRIARATARAPEQRRVELAGLLAARMDLGRILQYATHAEFQAAPAAIQQRFRASFASFLAEAYAPRIETASGFSFVASAPRAGAAQSVVVATVFRKPGYPEQQIDWTLAPLGSTYRIIDVSSDGVSLLEIQRSSFASVMRDGGMNELLARLDARTRELASAAR